MKKTKQMIIVISTAVIFLIIGMAIPNGEYQAGWNTAEQRLIETGFAPIMGIEDMEIRTVNGTVQEINNDKITLKIYPLEPLADSSLDIRVIEVANAKIYKFIEKNQEQFQKEMEEFEIKMREQAENSNSEIIDMSEPLMPPEMFIKQIANLNDIKVGQQLTVDTDIDIREAKQFKASKITIQFMPEISAMSDPLIDPDPTI